MKGKKWNIRIWRGISIYYQEHAIYTEKSYLLFQDPLILTHVQMGLLNPRDNFIIYFDNIWSLLHEIVNINALNEWGDDD